MTREEMIAKLEWYYDLATQEERNRPLVQEADRTWNLTQIMEQVHLKTDVAMVFVDNMIATETRRLN
jgi:hypothetical protein